MHTCVHVNIGVIKRKWTYGATDQNSGLAHAKHVLSHLTSLPGLESFKCLKYSFSNFPMMCSALSLKVTLQLVHDTSVENNDAIAGEIGIRYFNPYCLMHK